jgi:CRISPR-associated protein Csd1
MLLQRLLEYSHRIPSSPAMYGKMAVKWIIDIDEHGNFHGIATTADGGKKNDRGKEFLTPHIGRSSGIKAKLLADNGEYVLGKARDVSDEESVEKRNAAFIDLVRKAADSSGEPSVRAVLNFYQTNSHKFVESPEGFDSSHNVTFRINDLLPIELPSIQKFWATYCGVEVAEEDHSVNCADVMMCLICGESKPAVRRLPFKIKRIPNGQTAGNALISANSMAFTSYGLEESLIAPTCPECGEKFSKAANALLESENTHLTIGPLAYIFWTKEECSFSFASILSDPDPADVQALITSAFSGKEVAAEVDTTVFYASAFSASGARVAVRDWLETTVGTVKGNLARYFALQRIVEANGEPPKPLGISRLSAATVPLKKDKPDMDKLTPNVPRILLKCALEGKALPDWLLFQAVKRTKAEQGVRKSHVALIKMVLLSKSDNQSQEGTMEQLELQNRKPAYLCGRLLGVLESIQYAALGKTNSTIVGRYYGAASSAPASVFGTLMRGAQAHLEKLRKNREGAHSALQQRLEEVQSGLEKFPKTLKLEEQGLFALGYYHQKAADRASAAAHKLSKQTDDEK